jgi:hypothetical protein
VTGHKVARCYKSGHRYLNTIIFMCGEITHFQTLSQVGISVSMKVSDSFVSSYQNDGNLWNIVHVQTLRNFKKCLLIIESFIIRP